MDEIKIRMEAYDHEVARQERRRHRRHRQAHRRARAGPGPAADAHRALHGPALAAHRQEVARAVRDPHAQAASSSSASRRPRRSTRSRKLNLPAGVDIRIKAVAMEIPVPCLDRSGGVGKRAVEAARFKRPGTPVLLREAVVMYEAHKRVGTHSTKTRDEVAGSTKKMYKQKHTGHARHGDDKAPHFRGGGVCLGPHPRDYGYAMPKQGAAQGACGRAAREARRRRGAARRGALLRPPAHEGVRDAARAARGRTGAPRSCRRPRRNPCCSRCRNLPARRVPRGLGPERARRR